MNATYEKKVAASAVTGDVVMPFFIDAKFMQTDRTQGAICLIHTNLDLCSEPIRKFSRKYYLKVKQNIQI